MTARDTILSRIDAIGQSEVARAVAPAWGYENANSAIVRLSRWRHGGPDMPSAALFALLDVLGLKVTPKRRRPRGRIR